MQAYTIPARTQSPIFVVRQTSGCIVPTNAAGLGQLEPIFLNDYLTLILLAHPDIYESPVNINRTALNRYAWRAHLL